MADPIATPAEAHDLLARLATDLPPEDRRHLVAQLQEWTLTVQSARDREAREAAATAAMQARISANNDALTASTAGLSASTTVVGQATPYLRTLAEHAERSRALLGWLKSPRDVAIALLLVAAIFRPELRSWLGVILGGQPAAGGSP